MTAELAILHCEKAYEHFRKTKDQESLFYVLTLAAEIQAHSYEHDGGLSEPVQSLIQRLGDERKPATLEDAWQRWLRSLPPFLVEPGAP